MMSREVFCDSVVSDDFLLDYRKSGSFFIGLFG